MASCGRCSGGSNLSTESPNDITILREHNLGIRPLPHYSYMRKISAQACTLNDNTHVVPSHTSSHSTGINLFMEDMKNYRPSP